MDNFLRLLPTIKTLEKSDFGGNYDDNFINSPKSQREQQHLHKLRVQKQGTATCPGPAYSRMRGFFINHGFKKLRPKIGLDGDRDEIGNIIFNLPPDSTLNIGSVVMVPEEIKEFLEHGVVGDNILQAILVVLNQSSNNVAYLKNKPAKPNQSSRSELERLEKRTGGIVVVYNEEAISADPFPSLSFALARHKEVLCFGNRLLNSQEFRILQQGSKLYTNTYIPRKNVMLAVALEETVPDFGTFRQEIRNLVPEPTQMEHETLPSQLWAYEKVIDSALNNSTENQMRMGRWSLNKLEMDDIKQFLSILNRDSTHVYILLQGTIGEAKHVSPQRPPKLVAYIFKRSMRFLIFNCQDEFAYSFDSTELTPAQCRELQDLIGNWNLKLTASKILYAHPDDDECRVSDHSCSSICRIYGNEDQHPQLSSLSSLSYLSVLSQCSRPVNHMDDILGTSHPQCRDQCLKRVLWLKAPSNSLLPSSMDCMHWKYIRKVILVTILQDRFTPHYLMKSKYGLTSNVRRYQPLFEPPKKSVRPQIPDAAYIDVETMEYHNPARERGPVPTTNRFTLPGDSAESESEISSGSDESETEDLDETSAIEIGFDSTQCLPKESD